MVMNSVYLEAFNTGQIYCIGPSQLNQSLFLLAYFYHMYWCCGSQQASRSNNKNAGEEQPNASDV